MGRGLGRWRRLADSTHQGEARVTPTAWGMPLALDDGLLAQKGRLPEG